MYVVCIQRCRDCRVPQFNVHRDQRGGRADEGQSGVARSLSTAAFASRDTGDSLFINPHGQYLVRVLIDG